VHPEREGSHPTANYQVVIHGNVSLLLVAGEEAQQHSYGGEEQERAAQGSNPIHLRVEHGCRSSAAPAGFSFWGVVGGSQLHMPGVWRRHDEQRTEAATSRSNETNESNRADEQRNGEI
jgi:hypothetical protein